MALNRKAALGLMKEIQRLQTSPPDGIRVQANEDNMLDLTGVIEGPEGTPYAGGYFKVRFAFGPEFPNAPPQCRMATKIFHPNVSSAGEICVNTLKKDWKPTYGVEHILTTIKCLLIFPNPESALDEEAGKLLLEDYDEYCARARIVTSVHAKVRPAEFADAEVPPEAPSAPPAASSSKAILPPSISLASAPPPITPHAPRIPSSSHLHGGSTENEPSAGTVLLLKTLGKDSRHPSPAPLGLGGNVGFGTDSPLANTITGVVVGPLAKATKPVKAVKRTAASPPVVTNAEKRKKALKRL